MNNEETLNIIKREIAEKQQTRIIVSVFNKLFKLSDVLFHAIYKKQLDGNEDFTIISNNCWGE